MFWLAWMAARCYAVVRVVATCDAAEGVCCTAGEGQVGFPDDWPAQDVCSAPA